MRTAIIIAGGFVLLAVCLFAGRLMGVAKAGYSVTEELPIFLAIFALPAAAAGFVWWKPSP